MNYLKYAFPIILKCLVKTKVADEIIALNKMVMHQWILLAYSTTL